MDSYSCFWGLLTADNFDFIYTSKNLRDLGPKLNRSFIQTSLFDFIDPSNVPRLQKDLESFLSLSGFNGGSIRIKARNFWSSFYSPDSQSNQNSTDPRGSEAQPYVTYNVNMHVITPSIVLALFHIEEDILRKRCSYFKVNCFHHYDQEEIDLINSCLEESSRSSRRLPSLKSIHSFSNTPSILSPTSPGFPPFSVDTRSFLIYDSQTPQLLLAWPNENYLRLTRQAPQTRPSSSLDSLLHPRDINRLMSGISNHIQFNRYHVRTNLISEFSNFSGSKVEQIVYILGNITIACSQLVIPGNTPQSLQNQLHSSKSLSFTNEFNSNNSQYTIQRKISAPVLSNSGFPTLPPCSDITQDSQAPLAKKRSTELTSLHNYNFSRPKSSSTLVASREPENIAIPRKSVSNESFRRLEPHNIPSNSPKSSNRLLSFLSPVRPLSLSLTNRFRRNNLKPDSDGLTNPDSSTTLPSISQLCPQGFSEAERASHNSHTALPGISKLFSRIPETPCSSHAPNYPFPPLENSYGSVGRLLRPSHSSLTSPPLTSPLLNGPNRICLSCGTTNSPEWRRGPKGQKTLCNACGLKYSRQLKAARLQHQADMDATQFS